MSTSCMRRIISKRPIWHLVLLQGHRRCRSIGHSPDLSVFGGTRSRIRMAVRCQGHQLWKYLFNRCIVINRNRESPSSHSLSLRSTANVIGDFPGLPEQVDGELRVGAKPLTTGSATSKNLYENKNEYKVKSFRFTVEQTVLPPLSSSVTTVASKCCDKYSLLLSASVPSLSIWVWHNWPQIRTVQTRWRFTTPISERSATMQVCRTWSPADLSCP